MNMPTPEAKAEAKITIPPKTVTPSQVPSSIKKQVGSTDPKTQEKGKKRLTRWVEKETGETAGEAGREAQKLMDEMGSAILRKGSEFVHGLIAYGKEPMEKED